MEGQVVIHDLLKKKVLLLFYRHLIIVKLFKMQKKFSGLFTKGGIISEGILTLVLLPKKVPNLAPEQKICKNYFL